MNFRDPWGLCATASDRAVAKKNAIQPGSEQHKLFGGYYDWQSDFYIDVSKVDFRPQRKQKRFEYDEKSRTILIISDQYREELRWYNSLGSKSEQLGNIASYMALSLNAASAISVLTGNIQAAETFAATAAALDMFAAAVYGFGHNYDKATTAAIAAAVDLVPIFSLELKAAYNPVARRFMHAASKRFITNAIGKMKYMAPITISSSITLYPNLRH